MGRSSIMGLRGPVWAALALLPSLVAGPTPAASNAATPPGASPNATVSPPNRRREACALAFADLVAAVDRAVEDEERAEALSEERDALVDACGRAALGRALTVAHDRRWLAACRERQGDRTACERLLREIQFDDERRGDGVQRWFWQADGTLRGGDRRREAAR